MARLAACFTLLFIFLTLLSNPTFGSDPTYTECKPHIEATILDLAAKAVRAGEHPSEPAEQSQPCPGSTAPEEVQTSPEFQSSTAKKAVEYETSPEAASAEQASSSSRNEEKSPSHASSPTKKYSPSSEPSTKEKLYGFDNFMYLVFDYRPKPRDPKYANPWQTFPEFGKSSSSEKMPNKKVVSSEPGMIASSINKLIGLVFKVSDEPRDPKWKEPWQTHKGLSPQKTYPETVAKPKEVKKSFFEFSFINKLVQIVFGVDTSTSRDDKWSKPWTSHVESKKKEDKEVTPKRVVQDSKKGGFINFLVSLVFDVPTGERDPKWLEPWTTHKGLIKEEKKAPEVVKQVSGPGFFSKTINKLVYLVFTEPAGPRDPKYAQPWTSFREVKEKEPKVEVKVKESNFFGMRSTFNKLIEMIFGKSATTRDPKWAQPFQHHKKEQKESSETQKVPPSAAAPHPAAAPAPPLPAASPAPPPPAAAPAPPPPAASPAPPQPAAAPAPPPPEAAPAPPPLAATPAPPPTPSPSLFKEAFPSDTKVKHSKKKQIKKSSKTVKDKEAGMGEKQKIVAKAASDKIEKKSKDDTKVKNKGVDKSKVKESKKLLSKKRKKDSKDGQEEKLGKKDKLIKKKLQKKDKPKEKKIYKSKKSLNKKVEVKKLPKKVGSKQKSKKESSKRKQVHTKRKSKKDKISKKPPKQKSQEPKVLSQKLKKQPVKKDIDKKREVKKKDIKKIEAKTGKLKKKAKKKEIKTKDAKRKELKMDETKRKQLDKKEDKIKEYKKKKTKSKVKKKESKKIEDKKKSQLPKRTPKPSKKSTPKKGAKVSVSAGDKTDKHKKLKTAKGKSKSDSKRTPSKIKINLGVRKDGAKPGAPSADEQVAHAAKAPVKPVLEEVVQEREPKKEKIIEDQEQIVVVPSALRSREHIESILGLDEAARLSSARTDPIADATLRDLKQIHETAVKPLEVTYKYQDISNRHLSDAELFGTPLVLLLGPYSTGKSTFINYLLGIEFTKKALKTGTPPSHGVFRIVKYGERDREVDGTDLSGHWSFGSLQKFGQNFVDQIRGKEVNSPLLKKVTFVEAPGILEMRRPGERLYPFNDVVQWFIDRADLILVMFDYTKLDAGYELEAILDQLKGREAQSRILLNKADQVPPEELIKVQGSLFWNLSPLLGVSAPPTVYAGSFASLPYRPSSPVKLFQAQEEALLHDIARAINSRVDNRIAIARRHAVRVRNHAQMVDTYLKTFYKNKGFLTSKHKLAEEIVENPHAYNIYEGISLLTNISRYDLPDAEVYRDFFRVHNLYNFRTLRETCSYLAGCPLEKLDAAINKQLPGLMARYRRLVEAASPGAKLPDANIRTGGLGAGVAHAHHSKS